MPWLGGLDYKRLCSWMPYVSVVLVLTRDKGSGRVTIGADGLPRVHYWPNKQDRASMMNVSALSPLCMRCPVCHDICPLSCLGVCEHDDVHCWPNKQDRASMINVSRFLLWQRCTFLR